MPEMPDLALEHKTRPAGSLQVPAPELSAPVSFEQSLVCNPAVQQLQQLSPGPGSLCQHQLRFSCSWQLAGAELFINVSISSVPSTRYPRAPALLADESFQLFIKILRGHVQAMFVYTPPSWHPVLCSVPPSSPGSSGRSQASGSSWGGSFPAPPWQPSPAASPRNWLWQGRKRPQTFPETFPASLPFGVCPPSHSQTHTELERGQLHALGIQTQGASPGTLPEGTCWASRNSQCPSGNSQLPLASLLGVEGVMDTAQDSSGTGAAPGKG